jgi:hypothetical protein
MSVVDWMVDKVKETIVVEEETKKAYEATGPPIPYSETDSARLSCLREDISYYVIPPRKMSKPALHLLKQKVGEWLIKRNDIIAAYENSPQWRHILYFLGIAYIPT